jgi:nitrite reductase/ring-hydroxylating ferredoxin subunit
VVVPVAAVSFAMCAIYVMLLLPTWTTQVSKRLIATVANATASKSVAKAAALEETLPTVSKEVDFPPDYWTSSKLFQLEKRAIFSKTWLHVCHSSLFKKPGDYRTFNLADFSFLVVLGKDNRLRAFHNVCRHRAYTVATKSEGSCTVLRCRYHGWSYDTRGKLIKAPKFDEIQGFDKSQNGLFEIRTFQDSSGFLYANFDVYGSDGLTIRVGLPIRAKLSLVESWSVEAKFNWKIAVPQGTFRICSLAHLNKLAELFSDASGLFESWKWPVEFELSPLTRLMRSTNGEQWLTITVVPVSEKTSTIQCSFFCSRLDLKSTLPVSAIKQEVVDSVTKLEMIYAEVAESGEVPDAASQEPLLAEVKAHGRLERLMGQEVYPASRMRETSQACKVADDLCKELEETGGKLPAVESEDGLAW